MLQRFTRLSTAKCPKIHLSECQLDALRYPSGGQEATCGRCNSTEYPGLFPPNALWSLISQTTCGKIQIVSDANRHRGLHMNSAPHPFNVHFFFFSVCIPVEGVKYEDRTCCEIGSNVPSEMCPNEIDTSSSNEISIGIIVGSSIASLCVICCFGWVFTRSVTSRRQTHQRKLPWSPFLLSQQLWFLAPTLYLLALSCHRHMWSQETMHRLPTEVCLLQLLQWTQPFTFGIDFVLFCFSRSHEIIRRRLDRRCLSWHFVGWCLWIKVGLIPIR